MQRQAIHQQMALKSDLPEQDGLPTEQFIVPIALPLPIPLPSQPACPTLGEETVSGLISSAARKQSLDPALLKAVMKRESGFKPCAVSVKGALGLMQLMPATAHELHVSNIFDPTQNVQAGAAYLRQLLDRYNGDLRLALVGYNAGPGKADQPGTPYPVETQGYVSSIFSDLGIDSPDSSSNPPITPVTLTQTEEQMSAIPRP